MNCLEDEVSKRLKREEFKKELEKHLVGSNNTPQRRAEAHQLVEWAAAGADFVEAAANILGINLNDF